MTHSENQQYWGAWPSWLLLALIRALQHGSHMLHSFHAALHCLVPAMPRSQNLSLKPPVWGHLLNQLHSTA